MQELEPGANGGIEAPPPSVVFASGGLLWTRVRTPRLLSRVAKGIYGGGAVLALGAALIAGDAFIGGGITSLVAVLAWPLLIISYILSLTQSSFHATLEVSKTELTLLTKGIERKAIPRSKIAGALVVDREVFGSFVPTVEIELTNGDVLTARLADPRSAHAVVTALGFGVGGKRVHASLAKPTRRLWHALFGVIAYVIATTMMAFTVATDGGSGRLFELMYAAYPLLALLLYAGMRRAFRAPEITVGDDGVLVKRNLLRRFVPRSEISLVSAAHGRGLVIERTDGERIVVAGSLIDDARRSAIGRVIEERAGPRAASADRLAHYDRAGRDVAAWREHLARAMQQGSYRENAATVDEAVAVLRSAQASAEQRIGAALALRVAGEPKERIRVAAEAAADERVREALDAVAEAEDDLVIEKAVSRLT